MLFNRVFDNCASGRKVNGTLRQRYQTTIRVKAKLLSLSIERLNARRYSPFAGKLDVAKIVIAGHSLGGLTAFLGTEFDPRLKAAVMLDGFVPDALGSASRKPVLILAAGRQRWDAGECRLWSKRAAVILTSSDGTK
ncbi:MAG: hypothetical protein LAO23_17025 [Acidobacteriia bacterium]|nr:hypothetical protein [Terriglobia bacterium]